MDMETPASSVLEISPSTFVLDEQTVYDWEINPFQEQCLSESMLEALFLLSQYPFLTARILLLCVKDLTEQELSFLYQSGYLASFRITDKQDVSKVRLCLYVASHPEDGYFDGEEIPYPMDELLRMPAGRVLEHAVLSEWCVCLLRSYGKDIEVGLVEETEHAFFVVSAKKEVSIKRKRSFRHSVCIFHIVARRKDDYPLKTFARHLLEMAGDYFRDEHTYFLILCESEGDMHDHAMYIKDLSMERGEPYLSAMFLYAMEQDCLLEPGPLKYCNIYYEKDDAVIRQQIAFR